MNDEIGWHFPPTNGGLGDGFNNPGIAHFNGSPLTSLARETIQNSLDASDVSNEKVHVSFELIDLNPEKIGREEIKSSIVACKEAAEADCDSTAGSALDTAARVIDMNQISCLRVSDRHTTGLLGNHWRTLVKMQGISYKPELEGAGGSHGIGKYAPFAVSIFRTVFYWTHFREERKSHEKFQGKSVLMSHKNLDGEETQGTGFYGLKKDCQELTHSIPECFRVLNKDKQPIQGTSLTIMGFRETDNWRQRIAASVMENFFYAIGTAQLAVTVEPDETSDLIEINNESIADWFDYLMGTKELEDSQTASENPLKDAYEFWKLSKSEPVAEKQDSDLGHCRLWLATADGLPSKVAFVRRTGMLVTARQRGLIRFQGFKDFAALCVFEDPKGNELLRKMENPQHDQFEPDRLPKEDQSRGRRALKRVTDWVRSEIRKQAGPSQSGNKTLLSELAIYLPDYHPEESFDDGGQEGGESSSEPGFGEQVTITLKPIRRLVSPKLDVEDGVEADNGSGDDTGGSGGGSTGENSGDGGDGGTGEGDGKGGTGTRGGGSAQQGISVSAVRMLPIPKSKNCYQLSFLAEADGIARIVLEEAGDSSALPRNDIRAVDEHISLEQVRLSKDQRTVIEVTADEPIEGRAWRLSAFTEVQRS